ncbi:hypothetical protein SEA_A3WALLY_291 [Microbacterium phage A3Wally]|nr:hypothetical protein SEA_A3WALLY_291 [Microbacterium phage A3Wally]
MANINDLKSWWTSNSWMMEDHWDEYLELGNIIKALADDANAESIAEEPSELPPRRYTAPRRVVEVPPGHFDRAVQLPVAPFGVEEFGQPVTPDIRPKLDPLPYVQYEGSTVEKRYSAADPMRVHGQFKPRKGFEEDETKYSFIERFRRNRG